MTDTDPFTGPAPDRIPLPNAPLAAVLAQVRFEEVFSVTKKEFIADFQERIREAYPVNQKDQGIVLRVGPDGAQSAAEAHWRFFDPAKKWRVTLTTSFLSIETRAYTSRDDFIDRLGELLAAVEATIKPSFCRRIGVRYVDRISGEPLGYLEKLVRAELAGFAASSHLRSSVLQSIHESLCSVDEGKLLVRWGLIPENVTHDPEMMPQIDQKSWMLDIDVFMEMGEATEKFEASKIKENAYKCATRAYKFFRWATTDAFLRTYGGEV